MYLPGGFGLRVLRRLAFPGLMQLQITCMKGKRRSAGIRSGRKLHSGEFGAIVRVCRRLEPLGFLSAPPPPHYH